MLVVGTPKGIKRKYLSQAHPQFFSMMCPMGMYLYTEERSKWLDLGEWKCVLRESHHSSVASRVPFY